MASSSRALSEEIDRLFEYYLNLLNQYDALRSELSTLQSSIQQHIARANFDAQRGVRYGRDLYDQRMQAARLCRVTTSPETGTTLFEISTVGRDNSDCSEGGERGVQGENAADAPKEEKTRIAVLKGDAGVQNGMADKDGERPEVQTDAAETSDEQQARTNKPKDPIRMFGILTPQALRLAQGGAIKMVEDLVPKLASVDAEMKEVEIKIRRARKHRAKAEALEKVGNTTGMGDSRQEGVVS